MIYVIITGRQKGRTTDRPVEHKTREEQLPGSKPIAIVVKDTVLIGRPMLDYPLIIGRLSAD